MLARNLTDRSPHPTMI
ncbi:hypothetical protein RDI58_007688 [Solanum bulbocastanum]|uniref:Uncharacterized protein n=1 Tax=Solanum bulbocastanum TaxID=147425 RepID=A0AAN8TVE2_SOLBU